MDFPIKDMIDCFIKAGREDLVSILELIIEELSQVYEDDTTDTEGEEEYIDIEIDKDGFHKLK